LTLRRRRADNGWTRFRELRTRLESRRMFKRVVITAFLVLGLMIAIKDGRVLRETGFKGSCSVVRTAVDGSQVQACKPGKLEGTPDLRRQGCMDAGGLGKVEYWSCPASVVGSVGS
jgi:hypothetical protein